MHKTLALLHEQGTNPANRILPPPLIFRKCKFRKNTLMLKENVFVYMFTYCTRNECNINGGDKNNIK